MSCKGDLLTPTAIGGVPGILIDLLKGLDASKFHFSRAGHLSIFFAIFRFSNVLNNKIMSSRFFFAIIAEILARSLANFYCQ